MFRILAIASLSLFCTACSDDSPVPGGNPADGRETDFRGYIYAHDAMIGEGNKVFWAQQALSGYRRSTATDMPAAIATLPAASCRFRAPGRHELVRYVHVRRGRQTTPIYQFDRREVGKEAKRYVRNYVARKGRRGAYQIGRNGKPAMTLVNVIVTEPDKPVYLVLTGQDPVLWNIQKAANSKISAIAVIGGKSAAIANVPDGVPVRTMIHANLTKRLERCRVAPARWPEAHWRFVKNAGGLSSRDRDLRENKMAARRYSHWIDKNFDVPDFRKITQVRTFSNVLVGPLPNSLEARVPMRSISGATVRVSRHDYVFASSKNAYKAKFSELVNNAAREAAGGDLSLLLSGS